ncbi:hypothetical protein [Staphylococcus aureus]|uniref:hypothetical protein n=1 Tax=Staphylococcus aureus TaxID=1280 RepID=UPI003D9BA247
MRKLKEDDQVIVYEYIPQDKIEKGKGEITVNKLDSKVIDYKLSKVENEKGVKSRLLCKMLYNVFTISTYQN